MILILFSLAIIIFSYYFAKRRDLSISRIFIFSTIPPLVFSNLLIFISLFREGLLLKDFLILFFIAPFSIYIILFPASIFTSTLILFFEKHYPSSIKVLILKGFIIAYTSVSLYMLFIFRTFQAPINGWYIPALASIMIAISIFIFKKFAKEAK